MYESGRFFTVTGQRVPGTPATIEGRTEEVRQIHAKYIAKPEPVAKPKPERSTLKEASYS